MKHIIRGSIILFSVLAICVSAAQKKTSLVSGMLEIANSALSMITAVGELFETSTGRNELEHLMKDISDLKKAFEDALTNMGAKMDQNTYKEIITRYTDKIESCKVDYINYKTNSTDVAINNLLKCNDIMWSVRSLKKYLTGKQIYDTKNLFDLYRKESGVCDGYAMDRIYKEFFAHYVIGCIIATEIESVENNGKRGYFADECKHTMSEIITYAGDLYRDCAQNSYAEFCSVQTKTTTLTSLKDLYADLSEKYPWFSFVIVKLRKGSKAKVGGNLSVGHYQIQGQEDSYGITVFDVFTEVSREKHNYSLAIDVDVKDYKDHFFENNTMTVSYFANLTWRFVGFATENNWSYLKQNKNVTSCGTNTSSSSCFKIGHLSVFLCILCGIYIAKQCTRT